MSIHTRLATLVSAAALLIGISAATGAVAGSLVTSRDIKDGTIQSKDLDKQINTSLHKGASALRAVPKNSITSGTVRDGSLRLRDLVTATGTEGFVAQTLLDGRCTPLPAVNTRHTTRGALAFAQSSLGSDFTLSAQPDLTSSTALDITVCNNSGANFQADGANGDTFRWELIED